MTAEFNFGRSEDSPFKKEADQIKAASLEVAQHNTDKKNTMEINDELTRMLEESHDKFGDLF